MLNENSAYFNQETTSQKVRQRSHQRSLTGLLENYPKGPPQKKKSKAEKIKQKQDSNSRESEPEGSCRDYQSKDCQLNYRLVYIDMTKDNKQELRLSQK